MNGLEHIWILHESLLSLANRGRLAGYTVVVLEVETENLIGLVECYYFHP